LRFLFCCGFHGGGTRLLNAVNEVTEVKVKGIGPIQVSKRKEWEVSLKNDKSRVPLSFFVV